MALALWVDTLDMTWWTHPWWTGLFIKILLLRWIQADSFKKQFCLTPKRVSERCSQQVEIYSTLQKVINMAVMLYLSSFKGNSQETVTVCGGRTVQIWKQKSTQCCKLCHISQYLFTYIIWSTIS